MFSKIKESDLKVGCVLKMHSSNQDYFADCMVTNVLAGGYIKVSRPYFTTADGLLCESFLVATDAVVDNDNWHIYKEKEDD